VAGRGAREKKGKGQKEKRRKGASNMKKAASPLLPCSHTRNESKTMAFASVALTGMTSFRETQRRGDAETQSPQPPMIIEVALLFE
jgi:hypothetical protein